jgi:hypothetical protein
MVLGIMRSPYRWVAPGIALCSRTGTLDFDSTLDAERWRSPAAESRSDAGGGPSTIGVQSSHFFRNALLYLAKLSP